MTETFEFGSVIRAYHVYQHIWDAEIGDIVTCQREEKNDFDRYAVALLSGNTVVGHVPAENSKVFSFFLKRGGWIQATVVGVRENTGMGLLNIKYWSKFLTHICS